MQQGGSPFGAYQYVFESGIPDDTCQIYRAKDDTCEPINVCRNCMPWVQQNCFAVSEYTKYTVTEYGHVNGTDAMMAEVYARGPIACEIDDTGMQT